MYIEEAIQQAQEIKPIDKVIDFDTIPSSIFPNEILYRATKKIIYPFGYEFKLGTLLGRSREELNGYVREYWNVERNYTQN